MNRRRLLLIVAVLLAGLFFSVFPKKHVGAPVLEATTTQAAAAEAAAAPLPAVAAPHYGWYPVERVVDGDTLVVTEGTTSTKLRLIGLDTPETVDPRKPVQCFGREASDEAKKLLSGQEVRLEYDPSQGMLDKYGRTLAYVFLTNGTLFNEFMIAEGYGHEYTYNLPYKYQKEFKAAEAQARANLRGLWAPDSCNGNTSKPAASS